MSREGDGGEGFEEEEVEVEVEEELEVDDVEGGEEEETEEGGKEEEEEETEEGGKEEEEEEIEDGVREDEEEEIEEGVREEEEEEIEEGVREEEEEEIEEGGKEEEEEEIEEGGRDEEEEEIEEGGRDEEEEEIEEGGREEEEEDIEEGGKEEEDEMHEEEEAMDEEMQEDGDKEAERKEEEESSPDGVREEAEEKPNEPSPQITLLDDNKSPSIHEMKNAGTSEKCFSDVVTDLKFDHRRSPVSTPMEPVRSFAIPALGGVHSSGLDHRSSSLTVQAENTTSRGTSILDSIHIAGIDYRRSPVPQQMDNMGTRNRSTLIRSRSPSTDVTFETSNKRPSLVCDFYAKGWCIKGNSCRFLHQKEDAPNMISRQAIDLENKDNSESASTMLQRALIRAYGEEKSHMFYDTASMSTGPMKSRKKDIESKKDFLNEASLPNISAASGNLSTSMQFHDSSNTTVGMKKYNLSYTSRDWDPSTPKLSSRFEPGSSYSLTGHVGHHSAKSLTHGTSSTGYQAAMHKSISLGDKRPGIMSGWEPSVPFRSSFCPMPPSLSSTNDQYDPLIDSIEPSKANIDQPGLHRRDLLLGDGASPGFNHFRFGGSFALGSEPTDTAFGKQMAISVGTACGPTLTDGGNGNSTFQGLKGSPVYVSDPSNVRKDTSERNTKILEDRGGSHKESKASKVFRASVADFVKDLLKPSWLGGHLSKDAHKLIVKKAVEKVCSALQPHQIPVNNESTNQYFFSNRPKIVKLVEGYVEKYAKS